MATRLSQFEEFMLLFNTVKTVVRDSPERLVAFHDDSKEVSGAVSKLKDFLLETDFEQRVSHGLKVFTQAPPGFEAAWNDYQSRWDRALSHIEMREPLRALGFGAEFDPDASTDAIEPGPPDPRYDNAFDPRYHDLGSAIELGIKQLENRAGWDDDDEWVINSCCIALNGYDYLTNTMGLNIGDVFRRRRKLPPIFMPAHVSNRYGASDRGSLPLLLDEAVRAYVFGAPAAALTLCRAAFEMILKQHYGEGEWENPKKKLAEVIALAAKRGIIKPEDIQPLIRRADGVLHRYAQEHALSDEDERTILIFLLTLKSLIEQAPPP